MIRRIPDDVAGHFLSATDTPQIIRVGIHDNGSLCSRIPLFPGPKLQESQTGDFPIRHTIGTVSKATLKQLINLRILSVALR